MSRAKEGMDFSKVRADMTEAINNNVVSFDALNRVFGYKDTSGLNKFLAGKSKSIPFEKVTEFCRIAGYTIERYKLEDEVVEEFAQQELPVDQPIRIETTIVDYLKSINKYLCTLAEQQDEIIAGIRLLMEEAKTLYKEVKHGN